MKLSHIPSLINRYRHLVTIQSVGLAVALLIALSWMWGAVTTLQKNYRHQRQVDINSQQIELAKLQNQNYKYQQAYYSSEEFLELSARQKLGKALPGEHLVMLPSSENIKDVVVKSLEPVKATNESNLERWISFFFEAR